MKPLEQIDYTPLQAMNKAWAKVLRDTFKMPPALFLGLVVVLTAVLIYFAGQFAIWALVFVAGWVGKKVTDYRERTWHEFAQVNGWYIVPAPLAGSSFVPPGISGKGHSKRLSLVIHAQFEGHECDLLMYQFTTGSGKNRTTHYYTVARVELARTFPHLILDSKSTWAIREHGNATQRIGLEGDFDKHFSLYCLPNEQIEALSIITPDVMQTLIDANKPQDIEIVDNYLYFMCAHDRRDAAGLPPLLVSVDALAEQIAHKAKTIRYAQTNSVPTGVLSGAVSSYFRSGNEVIGNLSWTFLFIVLLPVLLLILIGFMTSVLT